MTTPSPEIIEVDAQQMQELLDRAESNTLRDEDTELIRQIFESYAQFFHIVGDKSTTIARLRKALFGASTEKTEKVLGHTSDSQPPSEAAGGQAEQADSCADRSSDQKEPAPGHGRNGAGDYRGAEHVEVSHPTLSAGDACLECPKGILYDKQPSVLVRFVGQPPLKATVYWMQRLRCHLCGKIFTAEAPEAAGSTKYDATAASMIALLKYGSGLPFNRLEGLQRNMEIPLPASTQWDVIAAFAPSAAPAYEELIRQAAQGEVVHNDDTAVRILELMGERAKKQALEGDDKPKRTGLFTSGVVSTRAGRRVVLFFSGRQHVGENLADVLKCRAEELEQPIQMCDGLSRNLPGELKTIVANCLAHARRQFVEVADRFEDECEYVLQALRVVYRTEAEARRKNLSPAKRLQLHRAKSQQTMSRLHQWLKRQLDEKLVEPNSALGEAIRYMLNHWDKLTRFLEVPGAPLDNNICERALKRAIVHRKNALFYKTRRGARVGDMYMSLIYTCELSRVSPFDYLAALHRHADQVADAPENWMPWNYRSVPETATAGVLA